MNRILRTCAAGLLGLSLVACQSETPQATDAETLAADSPADVSERIAGELKDDNVLGALQAAMPPADFDEVKRRFEESRKEPPSAEDSAEFAANMAKLTAADAEQQLMAELEPLLAKYEAEMAAQLPMFVAMGRGYAQTFLQESKEISEDEKKQATQLLDGIANWLSTVNFGDRDLARQAIAKAVATARALDLQTLEQAQALEFEPAMAKAGIVFSGIKDILAVYGLNVDAALASVDSSVVSEQGDSARVKIAYRLFDKPLEVEADMVRRDGRWYGKDTLAKLDAERSKAAQAEAGDEADAAADADAAVEPATKAAVGED